MLYGFSGFGETTRQTSTSVVGTRSPSMLMTQTSVQLPPWSLAAARLGYKLAAYDKNDPQGICGDQFFSGGCARVYVKNGLSMWHKAFISELNAIKSQGNAASSMMLYETAKVVSERSDMSGDSALKALIPTYTKVMGYQPLSPDQAAAQTGWSAPALATKPGIYGGTKTADSPTAILPGQPAETTPYPGQPGGQPAPSAEEEQAITGGGYDSGYQPVPDPGPSQQDVVFPEVPCPQGTHRPDPMGPCVPEDKKAMWPWVLGGVLVVGVGGYAVYAAGKKKRRR